MVPSMPLCTSAASSAPATLIKFNYKNLGIMETFSDRRASTGDSCPSALLTTAIMLSPRCNSDLYLPQNLVAIWPWVHLDVSIWACSDHTVCQWLNRDWSNPASPLTSCLRDIACANLLDIWGSWLTVFPFRTSHTRTILSSPPVSRVLAWKTSKNRNQWGTAYIIKCCCQGCPSMRKICCRGIRLKRQLWVIFSSVLTTWVHWRRIFPQSFRWWSKTPHSWVSI